MTPPIDHDSPAGAPIWSPLDPDAVCAACRQHRCAHSDLEFAGLVSAAEPACEGPDFPDHEGEWK